MTTTTDIATAARATFDNTVLSGASVHSWYGYGEYLDNPQARCARQAPFWKEAGLNRWEVTYFMDDPSDACLPAVEVKLTHESVLGACLLMVSDVRPEGVSEEAVEHARGLLTDPEKAAFPAGIADEVIQVVAYGKVVFS